MIEDFPGIDTVGVWHTRLHFGHSVGIMSSGSERVATYTNYGGTIKVNTHTQTHTQNTHTYTHTHTQTHTQNTHTNTHTYTHTHTHMHTPPPNHSH